MITQKPKEKSLSVLIHECDDVFSKYIRLRDTNKQNPFYLNCFTCGKPERIEFAQCMHFVDRDQMAVRYDEMNAHGGCETCNCFDPGHKIKYHDAIIQKYGLEKLVELMDRSKSLRKFMRHELIEMTEEFKLKIKALKR